MSNHLVSKSLLAVVAAASLGALVASTHTSSAAASKEALILDTRFVNLGPSVKEDECLTRAKTTLAALFKGSAHLDLHAGSHTQVAATADVVTQVECLQYSGVNGAYVIAAGSTTQKSDAAALAKVTEALQNALKGK